MCRHHCYIYAPKGYCWVFFSMPSFPKRVCFVIAHNYLADNRQV